MALTTRARAGLAGVMATSMMAAGLVAAAPRADAALIGSVVVYQCGASVCAMDPDVAGSNRVIAENASPAGVTRDGKTAGVVDHTTQTIREVALAPGGFSRTMATPGAADPPLLASISDTGAYAGWVWYYPDIGWYAQVAPAGGTWSAQTSSTSQLSIGWHGDRLMTSRRGSAGYDSRICLEVAGGDVCDELLTSEPDRTLQTAFPDINTAGTSVVAVRGPESSGLRLPYYGSLAIYPVGGTGPSKVLTTGEDSHPEFSVEGDRVVFERKDQGIWMINTDGTGLRKIADGSLPYWGGPRHDESPTPTPTVPNPTPTVPGPGPGAAIEFVSVQPVKRLRKPIVVTLRCPDAHSRGCAGTVRVHTIGPKKRRIVLAKGRYDLAAGSPGSARLRLTKDGARVLRPVGRLKVRVTATSTVPAGLAASSVMVIKRS
ncbi:hypothetical protein [Nocardioides sp.]|uniref:hypothetical protein n=1 Tax=Nocardioides sp. TaxID=35761 RepID=UPI002D1546BF|nr:hypothetical protein [Nocardioides sp.]HXH78646.1 hypothetical protein [Nocardioides sp.]